MEYSHSKRAFFVILLIIFVIAVLYIGRQYHENWMDFRNYTMLVPEQTNYLRETEERNISNPITQEAARLRNSPPILSNVVLSVDYNSYYFKYWQLITNGWEGLLGARVFLFLIVRDGQEIDLTELSPLGDNLRVVRVPNGSSTIQASQWARILGAGLVNAPPGGMNILSDMDLLPASAKYFYKPLRRLRNEKKEMLVYYRQGINDYSNELAIGYIAGHPVAWQRLTEVHDWNDFSQAMNKLPANYDDKHGGSGWTDDQKTLWKWAHDQSRNNGTILAGFKDLDLGFKRYDVLTSQKEVASLLPRVRDCEFTDIHMKAHDIGIPGPYLDMMTNVIKFCSIGRVVTMDYLDKADMLPVYGLSTKMSAPLLTSAFPSP